MKTDEIQPKIENSPVLNPLVRKLWLFAGSLIMIIQGAMCQTYVEINKEESSPARNYSTHYPTKESPARIPFTVKTSMDMQLFEVGTFSPEKWSYDTPSAQTGSYPIFVTSPETSTAIISFKNNTEVETYFVKQEGGSYLQSSLAINVEKVNWVMGELVSVSKANASNGDKNTLIDMSTGSIIRDISTSIVNRKCAWFGYGKVLCLTGEDNRFALYLPKVSDLSVALNLGVDGDIISPYKYKFDDNTGDSLQSGLVIACQKVSEYEVGCDSGEVSSTVVYHSWTFSMTLADSLDPENFIGIYPNEHLVSFVEKSNSSLHFLSTRDGSYAQTVELDSGSATVQGFWYNQYNSHLTFFDRANYLIVAKITGKNLTSIENCEDFVSFVEKCNTCSSGY